MNGTDPLLDQVPPSIYLAFQTSFMLFIMTLTILGNIAVCYVVYRTKSIATVTGMSITSLAVADLLRGSVILPFAIMTSIWGASWEFGDVLCTTTGVFHTMLGSASVMTLGAVSLDRYIAILKPLKYATIVTTIRAAVLLVFIWSLSSLIAILPLIGWSKYIFIPWTCICVVDWRPGHSHGYAYFNLLFAFLVPFLVLAYCYFRIFVVARHQSRRVMAMEVASVDQQTFQRNTTNGGFSSRAQRFTSMRKEKKGALTLFIVMGIFVSCVTPYCLVYLIASHYPTSKTLLAMGVTSMLSFLNSAANPMIYGILNRKFRRMFLHVIACKRCLENRTSNQAMHSDNGTFSTGKHARKRRQHRNDPNNRKRGKAFAATNSVFHLSVATTAGSTMACVLGETMSGLEQLTVRHLPTITDISESTGGRSDSQAPKKSKNKGKVKTITFKASVDTSHRKREHKTCDVMVFTGPMIKSIHIDRG